jgi:uncharacterized protein
VKRRFFLSMGTRIFERPVLRETKGQRVEVRLQKLRAFAAYGFHLCNLTSDLYNSAMPLIDQIQKDIVAAMKAREEHRLSTLRMVKTALKNREIDKMAPLDDKESHQVLSTLIKQRKDSVEQFTKGGRQEMADKEAAEIKLIETYLPKEAGEEEIVAGVRAAIAEMTPAPAMKDMGSVMKAAMARFAAAGMRVDGKVVSEAVKRELAGK